MFAGTLNGTGTLTVGVTHDPSQTVVARIVALVGEAAATKAQTQLFIEKVEQRYSVGVVVATVALLATPLVFGADLEPTLLRAMTFMIVASPVRWCWPPCRRCCRPSPTPGATASWSSRPSPWSAWPT